MTSLADVDLEHIHPQLRHLAVEISALVPDPDNARLHDGRNIDAIRESLTQFGQRKPLVVQQQGMLVRAGNGTLRAALDKGWTHVAALVVDEDDTKAIAFAIADNRTAELAEWDFKQLSSNIEEMDWELAGFGLSVLGFSENEVSGFSVSNAWDDVEINSGHIEGTRDNIDGNTLVLKFTLEQRDELMSLLDLEIVTSDGLLRSIRELGGGTD